MSTTRPSAPSSVKLQLRQESGFGCCICGHAFIQYHHIVPWAEDAHFRPEDMMTLCGNCHHLCTVGAITEKEQRASKNRPKNVVDGELRGSLYVTSNELKVSFGGGLAIDTPNLLVLREMPAVRAIKCDDGRVLVSAIIQSESGDIVARLIDNEWFVSSGEIWDFEAYPRQATIRLSPRSIAFSVDARKDTITVQGKWHLAGVPIQFGPNAVRWGNNNILQGNTIRNCGSAIVIG